MTKDKLVGTWQLVTFTATSGNQVSYPLGEHPGGYIGFSPARFWVMLVDSARKAPAAAALTDAEAVSLMKTSASYTGRYDVDPAQTPDGMKVTVHVDAASNQALTGTNRVFFMHVDGDKLTEIAGRGRSHDRVNERGSASLREDGLTPSAASGRGSSTPPVGRVSLYRNWHCWGPSGHPRPNSAPVRGR